MQQGNRPVPVQGECGGTTVWRVYGEHFDRHQYLILQLLCNLWYLCFLLEYCNPILSSFFIIMILSLCSSGPLGISSVERLLYPFFIYFPAFSLIVFFFCCILIDPISEPSLGSYWSSPTAGGMLSVRSALLVAAAITAQSLSAAMSRVAASVAPASWADDVTCAAKVMRGEKHAGLWSAFLSRLCSRDGAGRLALGGVPGGRIGQRQG